MKIKIEKVFILTALLSITIAIVLSLVVLFWLVYPYKPFVIKTSPINVITKEVKAGAILEYSLDYCRYTTANIMISRRFIDGIIFSTPDVTATNPIGCTVRKIGIEVPDTLPSGNYTLEIRYLIPVNPLRNMSVYGNTEQFKVINSQLDTD